MKIRKLHIKNYKVFNDLELDFTDANGKTLDKIVLAGVNGCGKTTILELIKKMFDRSLFFPTMEFLKSNIILEVELLDIEKKSILDYLNSLNIFSDSSDSFIGTLQNAIRYLSSDERNYSFVFGGREQHKSLDVFFLFVKSQYHSHNQLPNLIYLPIKEQELIQSETDDFAFRPEKNDVLHVIRIESDKENMNNLALVGVRNEIFENIDTPPRKSIENAIKKINDPLKILNLSTKLVNLESEQLIFKSANGELITFDDLSNGEKSLYFRSIYLTKLNIQNSIIMVDEPEVALHPTWQQKVMKLYQNIGENNQVIVATHSPHIIGASNPEEVFLLEIEGNQVEAVHPRHMKGHSIEYILEAMGTDPNNTAVINLVDSYLALMRKGMHETSEGLKVKAAILALKLDPNSEEMRRLDFSLRRFKVMGV
jgi:predicted ATP-binding protein involved in virulence